MTSPARVFHLGLLTEERRLKPLLFQDFAILLFLIFFCVCVKDNCVDLLFLSYNSHFIQTFF